MFFLLTFSSNIPSYNIRKTALFSKRVIEEPEYHGKSHESTIIYYDLIIPVILHRAVGGSKVSLSEKIPQEKTPHFGNGDSEKISVQGFSTVPDVTHSKIRSVN